MNKSNAILINELINIIQNKHKNHNASELNDNLEALEISTNEICPQLKPVIYVMLDFEII